MEQKKRKAIVVAQIGANGYLKLGYGKVEEKDNKLFLDAEKAYVSGYSFEAVCHRLREEKLIGDDEEIDVLLVGTKSSYWGNLCAYYRYRKKPLWEEISKTLESDINKEGNDKIKIEIPESTQERSVIKMIGIESDDNNRLVEDYLNECEYVKERKIHFSLVIVEHGITDLQLEKNFEKIRKAISRITEKLDKETEIELCFDISMGYRSLPMYVYNLANYLTRLEDKIYNGHVYYGMEAIRDKEYITIQGYKYVDNYRPLIDLHKIEELTRWTNVVNEFNEYGSVRGLVEMLESADDAGVDEDTKKERKRLADVFARFDYATNANNLKLLEESIQHIICIGEKYDRSESLLREYAELSESSYKISELGFPEEAQLLLEKISEDFRNRFGNAPKRCRYGYLTIKMAEWFYDQGRIGNAAIAVQEGIITYIFERYAELFMVNDESWRIYNTREVVKGKLLEYTDKGKIFFKFGYIKDNVRNINSHIIYNDKISIEDVKKGNAILEELIKYMVDEVEINAKPFKPKYSISHECLKDQLSKEITQDSYLNTDQLEKHLERILKILGKYSDYLMYHDRGVGRDRSKKLKDYAKENGLSIEVDLYEQDIRNNPILLESKLEYFLKKFGDSGKLKENNVKILNRMVDMSIGNGDYSKEHENKNYEECGRILYDMIAWFIRNPKKYWDVIR